MSEKFKVGLALGSGGVRGMAHFGVIRTLMKYGIEISCVAGVSSGSVIGAALASGKLIDPKSIPVEGITKITLDETELAELFGYTIKLIGYTEITEKGLIAMVSPRMIPSNNPLGRIDDVFNGVLVDANMVGEVMFYGPGAGKLPTASAVVADVIDIISAMNTEPKSIDWVAATAADMADFGEYSCRRMFIANGNADSLPSCIPCGETKCTDTMCAYVTAEPMSEKQVAELAKAFGDALVSVYRVL